MQLNSALGIELLLGKGVGLPAPPQGYAYVYRIDANSVKQLATFTNNAGITRPVYVAGVGA